MRDRGLFTRYRNDTVMFAPPFVTTDAELDEILGIAHDAICAVTGE
jgi:adenosylmethionine-8-amino-7-oxononanoate aminotransferase